MRQHVIPRVHLREFADPEAPASHPSNTPYEPSVWLHPRELAAAPMRRAPANLFVQRHAYTLQADDPDSPEVERWLSGVESNYAACLRKLKEGASLSSDEWRRVLLFVGALHARMPSQISHWQNQLDQLATLTRQVERAHTGSEAMSDREFLGWDEIGVRGIRSRAESLVRVLLGGTTYLVENDSCIPFFSADMPVVAAHLFAPTLDSWGIPRSLLLETPDERPYFVCLCPLTPRLALLSSHLFVPPSQIGWLRTADAKLIANLLWQVVGGADAYLLSHREHPLPDHIRRSFSDALQEVCRRAVAPLSLTLTTPAATFVIEASSLDTSMEGPLGRIQFTTTDLATLRRAAGLHTIVEVRYRDARGGAEGGMRDVRFQLVAIEETGVSHLVQG